ncbi:MAG: prolyl oligopeptidase family serine peptidase, partial [Bacteroidales bacterium]
VKPGLNYPYAENNSTVDSIFDLEIKDDYKWLEGNNPDNEKRNQWLAAQKKLTSHFFGTKKTFLENRIAELSEMPNYIPIEVRDSNVIYFKVNIYTNKTQLYAFNHLSGADNFIADLGYSLRALTRLKAAISDDLSKIAVINSVKENQTDLLIFDLKDTGKKPVVLSQVISYKPFWYDDKLLYIEDGFTANAFGNRVCLYDLNKKTSTLIYEDDLINIFEPLDIALNTEQDILYVSKHKLNKTYQSIAIDLKNPSNQKEVFSIEAKDSLNYRMAGTDNKHIFYVIYNQKFRSKIYAYNMETKKLHLLDYDPNRIFSHIYRVKDHVITSYRNMNDNKAVLINLKDSTKKILEVVKNGIPTFYDNKNGTEIVFTEESLHQSQVLKSTTVSNPTEINVLVRSKYMPFDASLFESEHITLESDKGYPINIIVSKRKNLSMDGSNPTILFSFPNLSLDESNRFYFSRIFFMEQGFIFVQRSAEDYKKHYTLKEKQEDAKRIIKYLTDNKYTSANKLCLSGFEYGSTIFANIMNENPQICRVALFSNGIFDMVNHSKMDRLHNNSQRFFAFHSKESLQNLLTKSPYHSIKRNENYPAILVLDGEGNQNIDPSHSYKYVAKLQMRTSGNNPILLYDQSKMQREDDMLVFDYREKIYYTINFFSEITGHELSSKNFSYPR